MKKNINLLLVLCLMSSCYVKNDITDTEMKSVVDSVEYHGIGQDNSLQTTPYWRVHVKGHDTWIRTQSPMNVGDSMTIILRK